MFSEVNNINISKSVKSKIINRSNAINSNSQFIEISEIYTSIQGEGLHVGLPCFFIRTSVCDLRCKWCDTPQALGKGKQVKIESIIESVPEHINLIQITGGEPLIQSEKVISLIEILTQHPHNKKIILETGGHRSLKNIPENVHIVMDIKLPASGESEKPFYENFPFLKKTDEIKFVVKDKNDFDKAVNWIKEYNLNLKAKLLFSPVWGNCEIKDLTEWLLESKIQARLQIQLHKIIWGGAAVGV